MKYPLLVVAEIAVLVGIVASLDAGKDRHDVPPGLLQVKSCSCTAHDEHTMIANTIPIETVDAKTGRVVTSFVTQRETEVITYRADIRVMFKDGSEWLPNGKALSLEFKEMKLAGRYCVDWNERVAKAIKEARKKGKR